MSKVLSSILSTGGKNTRPELDKSQQLFQAGDLMPICMSPTVREHSPHLHARFAREDTCLEVAWVCCFQTRASMCTHGTVP